MQQVAIITGASQGIGAAIAAELAANQVHVILIARDEIKLNSVAHNIKAKGETCSVYPCDVTKPAEIESTLDAIEAELANGQLILVNNAGFGGPFHRTDNVSDEEWDLVFDTNVKAAFLFCRRLLPKMKDANFGRVINISSIYGVIGGAYSSTYAASKHALIGYTKSLAVEWGNWNITCNCISPGYVDTAMGASKTNDYQTNIISHIPAGRQGLPDEVARLVAFLAKPENSYINGANLVIDGGVLAGYNFRESQ
jgi:3-oxoacyl-[acyl-carrier protein] reductase